MRAVTLASLLAASVFAAWSIAEDARPADGGERRWLSIPQIHAKLEAAGYRNIEKIERERGAYEVKATDRDGQRIKLYLNPQTGDIVDRKARHDKYGRSDADGQRNSADCNKRRCRDDLPQRGSAAPTGK